MKIKFYWFAVLASAALIAQAQAGGHSGGGGGGFGGGGGGFAARGGGGGFGGGGGGFAARGGGGPSFHSMPMGSFGGGRMIYSGQRFSGAGMRSPAFGQPYVHSNGQAFAGARQFTPGNINRSARFSNAGNRATANPRFERSGAGQVRSGNNLPSNWRNHVFAQHSAGWHRDWNRNSEHWWNGHRCRFVNGSWFIFDFGFDPWWPYWWDPYDYYGYGYYPYGYGYGYGANVYDNGDYYDQGGYADQYSDSTVAAAQERLAQQGYYRGQIDGAFGTETRRAVTRYQSNHGLRVTGSLTTDTLQALGLRRVASNG